MKIQQVLFDEHAAELRFDNGHRVTVEGTMEDIHAFLTLKNRLKFLDTLPPPPI